MELMYIHIPKTAGMYIREVVRKTLFKNGYRPDQIDKYVMIGNNLNLNTNSRASNIFLGHFPFFYYYFLEKWDIKIIASVREPIERTISHYNYMRLEEGHYEHRKAIQSQSLREYVEIAEYPNTLRNVMTRYLGYHPGPDIFYKLPWQAFHKRFETIDIDEEEVYDKALEHLERIDFILFQDDLCQGFRSMFTKFNLEYEDTAIQKITKKAPSDEELEILMELNDKDIKLYEHILRTVRNG